jgi:SAM-dependent methyltransferase
MMREPGAAAATADDEARRAYELVPYHSRAVPLSHPDHLCLAGFLGGLRPAHPERARVLEIGCGDAANLLPLAYHLRGGELLGVDASACAIDRGREAARRLGLDHLTLRHASIAELTPDELGTFDYVIAHGVLSWISDDDRRALLALVAAVLDPDGVAYVSYNTPQGWAVRGQVREVLRRRAALSEDPRERVARARALLGALAERVVTDEHPYGHLLAAELQLAASADDDYLLHEYLSPHNRPLSFRELRALAADHGLAPLRELSDATRDPRLELDLRAQLARHAEDDEVEECADLLTFRQLRATTLARADTPRRATGLGEVLSFGRYVAPLVAENPDVWIGPRVAASFHTPSGRVITTSDPLPKAGLLALAAAWPRGLSFDELLRDAVGRVRSSPEPIVLDDEAIDRFALELLSLRTAKVVHVTTRALRPARSCAEQPELSPLTRLEAARGEAVTTPYHALVPIDELDRHLAQRLDGTRTLAEVVTEMVGAIERGELALVDREREWPAERARAFLEERTERLALLAERCALFA